MTIQNTIVEAHVLMFQAQERHRYKNPEKPWIYYNPDGTSSIVGPVAKKKPPVS